MGCGNCGTGANGKPSGCKSNGGCSTGGCNRLNVFDWLSDIPLHDGAKPYTIIELSFNKGSRKEFFRNNTNYIVDKGEMLVVEGVGGFDIGQVSLTGELVKLQLKKYGVTEASVTKRVLHPATDEEIETSVKNKEREQEALVRARAIAKTLKLDMKLCEVEIQADGKKGTFFYTADQRVDFRELIKLFASDFRMKIEMRQIGARQESGKVGGIGSCGRELCCSTWLTDFKSVNTTAARYQNLSINQTKLSGQCGRLKCCLNYELDTYMDALSVFPDHVDKLETVKGIAYLQKRDIFKNLMWYTYSDNNKQYPLTIARVKEIQTMNKQGQKAEELGAVELEAKHGKGDSPKVDMGFVNDVGQITLKNLEKNKKKKKKGGNKPEGQRAEGGEGGQQQQARPQQQKGHGGGRPQGEQRQGQGQQGGKPQQQNRPQRQQQQKPQGQQGEGNNNTGDRAQQAEGGNNNNQQRQQRPPRPPRPERQGGEPKQQKPQGEGNTGGQQAEGGNNNNNGGQQQQRQQRPPRPPRPERQGGGEPKAAQPGGDGQPNANQQGQPKQQNQQRPPRPQGQQRPPRPNRPEGQGGGDNTPKTENAG